MKKDIRTRFKLFAKMQGDIVFFARQLRKDFEPIVLEPHQIPPLLDPHSKIYLDWDRRCGKSTILQVKTLHKMLFKPSSNHFYTAPRWDQVREYCEGMASIVEQTDFLGKLRRKPHNKFDIRFKIGGFTHSRFRGAAVGEKLVGRGASITDLYVDEVRDIPEETWASIMPASRGQMVEPEIFAASSRNTDAEDDPTMRFRKNPVYHIYSQRLCDVTVDAYKNITINKILIQTKRKGLTPEELMEDIDVLGVDRWLCEYAGIPLSGVGDAIPAELIDKRTVLNPTFESLEPICVGIDYGIAHNNCAVTIISLSGTKKRHLWTQVFPSGKEIDQVNDYVKNLKSRYDNILAVCPDQHGLGEHPVRNLIKILAPERIAVAKTPNHLGVKLNEETKRSLISSIILDLQQGNLLLSYHERLHREMKALKLEALKDSPYGSPDAFDSFLLAYWGTLNYSPKAANYLSIFLRGEGPKKEVRKTMQKEVVKFG